MNSQPKLEYMVQYINGESLLEQIIDESSTNPTGNINLANTYKVINSVNATNGQDLVPLSQTQALIAAATNKTLNQIGTTYPNTANVPMTNYHLTGMSKGTLSDDSVRYDQIQGSASNVNLIQDQITTPNNKITVGISDIKINSGGVDIDTITPYNTNCVKQVSGGFQMDMEGDNTLANEYNINGNRSDNGGLNGTQVNINQKDYGGNCIANLQLGLDSGSVLISFGSGFISSNPIGKQYFSYLQGLGVLNEVFALSPGQLGLGDNGLYMFADVVGEVIQNQFDRKTGYSPTTIVDPSAFVTNNWQFTSKKYVDDQIVSGGAVTSQIRFPLTGIATDTLTVSVNQLTAVINSVQSWYQNYIGGTLSTTYPLTITRVDNLYYCNQVNNLSFNPAAHTFLQLNQNSNQSFGGLFDVSSTMKISCSNSVYTTNNNLQLQAKWDSIQLLYINSINSEGSIQSIGQMDINLGVDNTTTGLSMYLLPTVRGLSIESNNRMGYTIDQTVAYTVQDQEFVTKKYALTLAGGIQTKIQDDNITPTQIIETDATLMTYTYANGGLETVQDITSRLTKTTNRDITYVLKNNDELSIKNPGTGILQLQASDNITMGTTSSYIFARQTADANGNFISARSNGTTGLSCHDNQDPITTVQNAYNYVTKGYLDSVGVSVQSIQNSAAPSVTYVKTNTSGQIKMRTALAGVETIISNDGGDNHAIISNTSGISLNNSTAQLYLNSTNVLALTNATLSMGNNKINFVQDPLPGDLQSAVTVNYLSTFVPTSNGTNTGVYSYYNGNSGSLSYVSTITKNTGWVTDFVSDIVNITYNGGASTWTINTPGRYQIALMLNLSLASGIGTSNLIMQLATTGGIPITSTYNWINCQPFSVAPVGTNNYQIQITGFINVTVPTTYQVQSNWQYNSINRNSVVFTKIA